MTEKTDIELAKILTDALDTIEEAIPRLAVAIAQRRRPDYRDMDVRHGRENAERSMRVLREDVEALTYSDAARAHRRAQKEMERIWRRARSKYERWAGSQRTPRDNIAPWGTLNGAEKAKWFGLADDRIPPTWNELTPDQRADFFQRHRGQALSPPQIHAEKRARGLRRRAYQHVEHSAPFTIKSPDARMAEVALMAELLSRSIDEHRMGRVNDLQLAIYEEHYRRALHAYTRPTEPYPEAP